MEAPTLQPSAPSQSARDPAPAAPLALSGATFLADCTGALYWPERRALVVADLHLEKGSAFAARGMLLPPWDTTETLQRLATVIGRYDPRLVIALGDNFHDDRGPARLAPPDRAALATLQHSRDWIWIAGNHDPDPAPEVGGISADAFALGPVVFRHAPAAGISNGTGDGEIAGHLHPCARVSVRGHVVARRCFVTDRRRLVMPAFGAYAGGLDIRDPAFRIVFGDRPVDAYLLGTRRTYAFSAIRR